MNLSVVILAAGKGKRMASDLPKVMHKLAGIPLLERVVTTANQINPERILVVYGNGRGIVRNAFQHLNVDWVNQEKQHGTGHAVLQALPQCGDDDRVLVLYGDVPLISVQTLQDLLNDTPKGGLGIIVSTVNDPKGLGHIIRDVEGNLIDIIEDRDATDQQRRIKEINSGIIVCSSRLLKKWLPNLKPHNNQKEQYLTDIISLAVKEKIPICDITAKCEYEIKGVNDLWQLTTLERCYQRQQAKKLALSGVRILDPERIDIRGDDIQIANDVTLDINVILIGKIRIGKNTCIGANCVVKNAIIGEEVSILPNTVIEDTEISDHSHVGPFARLREGTVLREKTKVGNFVEMKKTTLGVGSKASHLTYLGDAKIGDHVNIGAGTITCNYDGTNKWETIIENGAFIGSNTSLVAPVTIGENATIGAGSTINQNAPPYKLTLARAKQETITGWTRPAPVKQV